jgi:class 3 adenylate cyclase
VNTGLDRGFIVLADLSGFTRFVSATEIRHGAEAVAALLDVVVGRLSPPLHVEEIEGDAVFAISREPLSGAAPIVQLAEQAYVDFRERRRQIRLNTRCTCRACRSIDELDLKFVVHYGEFAPQRIGRRVKPSGPAVILAHRLLKVTVPGTHAWLLLTRPAFEQAGLTFDDPAFEQRQLDCDPLGTVDVLIRPLEAVWRRHSDASRPADASSSIFVLDYRLPARPEVVWGWLTLPEFRQRYDPGVTAISGSADVDPRSVQFQCDHGAFTVLETVREWRPYEVCARDTVIQPLGIPLRVTWKLTPDENATRVTVAVGSRPGAGPIARLAARLAAPALRRDIERSMASLARSLGEHEK